MPAKPSRLVEVKAVQTGRRNVLLAYNVVKVVLVGGGGG